MRGYWMKDSWGVEVFMPYRRPPIYFLDKNMTFIQVLPRKKQAKGGKKK